MKKSNKLLVALLAVSFLAIVGSNMILKAEYDKIDLNDPFYGFTLEEIKSFKAVRLNGNTYGLIQVQPGESYQLRVKKEHKNEISWSVRNDTLILSFKPKRDPHQLDRGDPYIFPAEVHIIAPEINLLYTEDVKTRMVGWRNAQLMVNHVNLGGMFLHDNTFLSFSAKVEDGGLIKVGTNNEIGEMTVQVNRYGSFEAEKDVFQSIKIEVDSFSNVKLPGTLYKKIDLE